MTPLKRQLQGSSALWGGSPRDPISIGNAILATIGVQTSSVLLIQAVGYIATTLVTSWAMNALTPKPELPDLSANSGRVLRNDRDVAAPHRVVYGEARVGGAVTYLESTGDDNKYLHMVIALAGHEVQEIGTIYINDEPVNLDASGFVTTADWQDGDGNSKIRINKHLGASGQAADADLVAESEKVDSAFRGRGIAYLYVRLEYDRDVFASGIPTFTAVVKGKKVYDPRSNSISWSANAALCVRDYISSGYGLGDTSVDDTMFAAAANVCDESVPLAAGGSEPRYEINGSFTLDQAPGKVLQRMMTACGGMLFFGGGEWKLKPGYYTPPVKTFTLDDLRGPITLDTRVSRRDTFNIVRGTFIDAGQDWITADYPEVYGAGFITEDNNLENPIDLELPFTTSKAAAQRIAKLTLFRGREQMSFQADFSLAAMEVEVGDIVALDNARYGWTGKEFEVIGWRFAADQDAGDLRVRLTLRETSAAAFSWNAEESDIIGNDTTLVSGAVGMPSGLTLASTALQLEDGTTVPTISAGWVPPADAFVEQYEIQWKEQAAADYNSAFTSAPLYNIQGVKVGTTYDVRVRSIGANGGRSGWLEGTHAVTGDDTAPADPTSLSASGHFKYITLTWTNPPDADLKQIEIWESADNVQGNAAQIAVVDGNTYTRSNLGLQETRFYWIRAVDFSGNKSAFVGPASGTTTYLDDPDFENGIRTLFEDQGLYAIEDVNGLPTSGSFVGQKVFNRQDGQLYDWDGAQWVATVPGVAPGSITATEIADDAITTPKLAANAVEAGNIAGNSITGDKIVANTITGGLLATSGIITNSAQINNALITGAKIQDLAVDTIKVKDRAITQQTSAQSAGGTNSTTSYTTEGTLSFSASSGEQVLVGAFFDFGVGNNDENDSKRGFYKVLFNGSQIDSGSLTASQAETETEQIGIVSSETTTSGTNTVQVQIRCDSSTQMSVSATDINLFSLEALK